MNEATLFAGLEDECARLMLENAERLASEARVSLAQRLASLFLLHTLFESSFTDRRL